MLVFPRISCMQWLVTPQTYRRSKDGTPDYSRAHAMQNSLGGPTPPGRDEGYVPRSRLYLLARPRTDAGHDHPALPLTDAARPYRGPPSAASVRPTVQRVGLLSSPRQA